MSNPHDSPSDAFSPLVQSPLTERLQPQQQQQESEPQHQLSPGDDSSPSSADSSGLIVKQPDNRQPDMNNQPQSILKKKGSFDSKTLITKKQLQSHQQQQQYHFSIQPILKRNSAGPEMAASMPTTVTGNQVHPILKKSSSEDRTWWREEPLRIDASSSSSSSAAATPRPILKKRSSADEVVRGSGEIRPILKRKDSPKIDPLEFTPKPIIKSLSRNGSDESNSSPTGHTSRVMIQEPFNSDHSSHDQADDQNTFTGPFMARVMQPRRKSHPVSSEDLRILNHPLLNGKRSPLPFSCSDSDRQNRQTSPNGHHNQYHNHSHFHDHHFAPRRSPPLLKSLPNSPSSLFERSDGMAVPYAFVDEFEKLEMFEKLSLLNSEHKSSPRNGNHIVDPHANENSHPQPPDSQ